MLYAPPLAANLQTIIDLHMHWDAIEAICHVLQSMLCQIEWCISRRFFFVLAPELNNRL